MNNDNEEWIRNVIAQAVATHADEEPTVGDAPTPNPSPAEVWHAADCGGSCDGCGYITARLRWLPGPCPCWARPFQTLRSEHGRAFPHLRLVWS